MCGNLRGAPVVCPRTMQTFPRRLTLTHWILIAMVVGVAAGSLYPEQAKQLRVLSTLFFNLIGNCLAAAVVARWEGELQT